MESKLIKSGFVAIIGLPNAGKSTFLNAIIKEKLSITSSKPQTTRKNLKGIYNDVDSQIVFIDTPGIHKGKSKLDAFMDTSINNALIDIDAIIVIIDAVTCNNDDFSSLTKILCSSNNINKILLVNKCDLVDPSFNINHNSLFENKISFDKVFYISSLKNKCIFDVIDYLKEVLPIGDRFYNISDLTDTPTRQIIADIIRQQCIYKLSKEIPYGIEIVIDSMKKSNTKCMNIYASIICEKETHKAIIIGKNGAMIKNIGTAARIYIEKFLRNKVNLKLNVLVKENWKNEKTLLSNFGYIN